MLGISIKPFIGILMVIVWAALLSLAVDQTQAQETIGSPSFATSQKALGQNLENINQSLAKTDKLLPDVPEVRTPPVQVDKPLNPAEPILKVDPIRTPKVKPPKVEALKVKPPKVEVPKVKPPKVEVPRVKPPKVEVPRVKPPKAEVPRVKPPKAEAPKPNSSEPTTTSTPSTTPPPVVSPPRESVRPKPPVASPVPEVTNPPESRRTTSPVSSGRASAPPESQRSSSSLFPTQENSISPQPFFSSNPVSLIEDLKPVQDGRKVGSGPSEGEPGVVERVIERVPESVLWALALLGLLSVLLGMAWLSQWYRKRMIRVKHIQALEDIGLLQTAILPIVPERIGPLALSVSYQPAGGLAAGGDFYDAFALNDGSVAVIIGDVSGHGKEKIAKTSLVHYTLRAHLLNGLSPAETLQVTSLSLDNQLQGDFATGAVAIYYPKTGRLSYALAGHPAPILVNTPQPSFSLTGVPLGIGVASGSRQTTVSLADNSRFLWFTDGLIEARVNGQFYGREGVEEAFSSPWFNNPESNSFDLLEQVNDETDLIDDDMAVCIGHVLPREGDNDKSGESYIQEEVLLQQAGSWKDKLEKLAEAMEMDQDQYQLFLGEVNSLILHGPVWASVTRQGDHLSFQAEGARS